MAIPHTEEIVYAETKDGFILEGVALTPAAPSGRKLAVIWVHGLTGRFYARTQMLVSRDLVAEGYTVVSGNNRGHDFGARIPRKHGEPVLAGGGWELFEESPHDVDAWITFAASLGFERIAVIGHSLGALKAAHYQATRQDARVAGLVAASPPIQATRVDPHLVALAEKLAAEGKGRDLLPWGSSRAGAGTHSATTFLNRLKVGLDQYGLDAAEPEIGKVRCPVLALFGTVQDTGDEADLAMIRRNATAAARVDTAMIDGADHVYTGRESAVARVITEWLARIA